MGIVRNAHFIYTVHPGDTLYLLASRFASSVQAIQQANFLRPPVTDPGLLYPGQVLVIPRVVTERGQTLYVVGEGDTLSRMANRFSTFPELLVGINPGVQDSNLIFPGQQLLIPALIYEVASGDTLNKISRRFGVPLTVIIQANKGRLSFSPDIIWPGYRVIVPLPTSRNIAVFRPYPGTDIRSGQRLEGWARAFEANVLYQVRDRNGVIVSDERFTTASIGAPAYGEFTSTLPFDRQPTSAVGEVWVYTRSARDGSIQDLVRLKVYFREYEYNVKMFVGEKPY